nr:hypothetical protein [uncultured Rhodopila sp.]
MKYGIHLPHAGEQATPALIRRHAERAEDLGLEDVWVSEHINLSEGRLILGAGSAGVGHLLVAPNDRNVDDWEKVTDGVGALAA